MPRSILRMVLITLALGLLFTGSSTRADEAAADGDVVVAPGKDLCAELAGCEGGPYLCASIILSDGTTIMCYGKLH